MKPAETYKNWILQTQQVFYVEVWDSSGHHYIAVRHAKSEEEAMELAKAWIDKYEAHTNPLNYIETREEFADGDYDF